MDGSQCSPQDVKISLHTGLAPSDCAWGVAIRSRFGQSNICFHWHKHKKSASLLRWDLSSVYRLRRNGNCQTLLKKAVCPPRLRSSTLPRGSTRVFASKVLTRLKHKTPGSSMGFKEARFRKQFKRHHQKMLDASSAKAHYHGYYYTLKVSCHCKTFTATLSCKFPRLIRFLPVPEFLHLSSGINASKLSTDSKGKALWAFYSCWLTPECVPCPTYGTI